MQWIHKDLTVGAISFAPRHRTPIVGGRFEAPDDPTLAARLVGAGHIPIKPEGGEDGAPDADAERKAEKPGKKAKGG